MKKSAIFFAGSFIFLFLLFFAENVSAQVQFNMSGRIYDVNGKILNNSVINFTIYDATLNIVGYNFTTSNSSGHYNLSVWGQNQ